ncbi:unnamed protein product [Angiostrongylus costaricensis]|uniref:SET domain-containing protein n=1 Tax=Angiostrongylus costaricensis TaxID=334426 RepID=A0A158PI46_ANGCS|nr:unnamed protein product [Angiostrongylus costaricensis]
MEVDETLVNGVTESNDDGGDKMEESDSYDSDEERSDFYRKHPCARNERMFVENFLFRKSSVFPLSMNFCQLLHPRTPFIPPSQREDAPLASILNPQLDKVDPRRFFTDYELNSVVRFSRIFAANIKSSSKAEIWWPSKTYHKRIASEALMIASKSKSKPHANTFNSHDGQTDEVLFCKVLDDLKCGEPACGWVPTQYTRTYEQFMLAGENNYDKHFLSLFLKNRNFNDDYYLPKAVNKSGPAGNSMLIQHSIPAQNIHRTFFPTFLIPSKLRHFHRQPLSRRVVRQFNGRWVDQREKQRCAEGGGDIFFMRDVADLSGRDGDLILLEYSEEHPPLLCQPGMASKIKNYYKKVNVDPDFEYGDMAYLHTVPFLGQLQPGQAMQSIENNLFRAPIYQHSPQYTDYLLIRNRNGWFIRPCPPIFLVGQECPLYEVPSPNSKRATIFVRDFLLVCCFRSSYCSHSCYKTNTFETMFRFQTSKLLGTFMAKLLCVYLSEVLRPEFRLPSKEEVLAMVTPEMCCAQYSMLAAEQRLKDAGYGEKYFFTPENEDDSDDQVTIEDEIKCAPWNTTRAFLSSMRGKCLLDQTGIADPTGCGQGFSYVRVSQKPQKDDTPAMPKRLVTGTNADLRKLPLKEAKEICRDYGVREEEINALSRWEIIDVIRTLSTQAAKAKADSSGDHGNVSGMARFARGNIRFNFADMQEKYKKHCQHIFDLQNQLVLLYIRSFWDYFVMKCIFIERLKRCCRQIKVLFSFRPAKHISMSERARMEFENEEKERQDLKRMVHGDMAGKTEKDKKEATAEEKKNVSKIGEDLAASASKISGITANQKLKIYRTMKNPDGTESTRVEVVTRPQLIEAYTRIRMTKDENFIEVYAQMDEQFKEERRKQKRRLQDQLRRIRRNEEKGKTGHPPQRVVEKKPIPIKPNLQKMRCSACHGTGHMKTNKNCPLYGKDPLKTATKDAGSGTSDGDEDPSSLTGELVAVEGTKVKISRKVINIRPRLSAGAGVSSTKRRVSTLPEEDYLHGPHKSVQRIRADPKVTMGTLLTEIVTELKSIPGSEHLMFAVNAKKVKDYYDIVKNPMDLQKIKSKIADNKYELRQEFLLDVKRMLDNSRLYNGDNHVITDAAKKMFELASKRLVEKEQQLMKLEKAINPLLDDNDRVGFGFVLEKIVQACKNIPKSVPFHNRVDAKKVPFYYEKVSKPMDLGTIEANVKAHRYVTVQEFHVYLILIHNRTSHTSHFADLTTSCIRFVSSYPLTTKVIRRFACSFG